MLFRDMVKFIPGFPWNSYLIKGDLEILNLFPPPFQCWDFKPKLSYLIVGKNVKIPNTYRWLKLSHRRMFSVKEKVWKAMGTIKIWSLSDQEEKWRGNYLVIQHCYRNIILCCPNIRWQGTKTKPQLYSRVVYLIICQHGQCRLTASLKNNCIRVVQNTTLKMIQWEAGVCQYFQNYRLNLSVIH